MRADDDVLKDISSHRCLAFGAAGSDTCGLDFAISLITPPSAEPGEHKIVPYYPSTAAPVECVKAAAVEATVSERFLIAAADDLGGRCHAGQWWLPGVNASPTI